MRSLPDSPDPGRTPLPAVPLAAEGGIASVVAPTTDWFTALDDLMTVIEAFCPTWPHRENFGPMRDLRL
jgi:hypothetical protein